MHLITKLAAVVPAAALTLIGPALSAGASTHGAGTHGTRPLFRPAAGPDTMGTTQYAQGSAGYNATGASVGTNFKSVTGTATLRDPSEYASVTDGIGFGVTLKSGTDEVDLGVSAPTTPGTDYSPAVDLYVNGALVSGPTPYGAQWCPAGGACQPAAAGGAFAPGDKVTETLSFNTGDGVLDYTAYDAAGNVFTGQFGGLKGQHFSEADVGGGFGSFNAPPTPELFVTFKSVGLVTYGGTHYTLGSSAIVASPQYATSDGMSDGAVQAKPSRLKKGGTTFSLRFEPAG